MKVGDRVVYIGPDNPRLAIDNGDVGIVVLGRTEWADGSVSVHFKKWAAKGGSQHPAGRETHRVDGVEAFYIGIDELEKHAPCMFGSET